MKICVLHSSYQHSASPMKEHDSALSITQHLPGHDVEIVGLHKAIAVRELRQLARRGFDVFINLCDGARDEDRAGIEVVEELERLKVPFTGAASNFYEPSRESMKRACHYYGLPTPDYRFAKTSEGVADAARALRFPLIVKHAESYSSIGMTPASRIESIDALHTESARMIKEFGEVLIEEFIDGREFTVLVTENAEKPSEPIVFRPIEFVFSAGETFKHFDLKWIDYEKMRCVPCSDPILGEKLRAISSQMFLALDGSGFGRCDIRVDAAGELYLLEINPNCGVFCAPYASADWILAGEPNGYRTFVDLLLKAALSRGRVQLKNWCLRFDSRSQYGMYAVTDIQPGEMIQAFEEQPHVLVTRSHVERCWSKLQKDWFARYAYPLTEEVWVTWSNCADDWKPINHSCDPNAWLSGLNVVARRFIRTGEQITLDYATFNHEDMPAFTCQCGATTCRGRVTGADSLKPFMRAYGDHVSDYVRNRRRSGARS